MTTYNLVVIETSTDISQLGKAATLLEENKASIRKYVMKELQNLKVDIRLQTRVVDSTQLSDGRQELTLSSGEKLITHLYIPAFGFIPNSSFIPAKFLNDKGYVMVDEYLKLKGTGDAWAIGDINDAEWTQYIYADLQSAYAAKSIVLILSNKRPAPYKLSSPRMTILLIMKLDIKLIFCRYPGSLGW